jgi:hypothetical protein
VPDWDRLGHGRARGFSCPATLDAIARLAVADPSGMPDGRGHDPMCGKGQPHSNCRILRNIALTIAEIRKWCIQHRDELSPVAVLDNRPVHGLSKILGMAFLLG